ncbi:S1C family serine protease [Ornithinimicrobium panacihumi]|uniref:S1C family serine protease n=1 Tax=Ornithinimicrobium panacihumi TaxID=2008449 RepID=UPI003F88DA9E
MNTTPSSPANDHDRTQPVPALTQASPSPRPTRPRRRWSDIAIASVLAAVLSSGGTYAAVRAADSAGAGSTEASTSAQAGDNSSGDVPARPVSFRDEQDWAGIAATVTPSVVSIDTAGRGGQGSGSGVVWDTEGHIVTNAHVVEGAEQLRVTLADGRSYEGTVVGDDPSSDLAVVKLSTVPDGLTPIAVGDDKALEVGDPVMAVGNPLGLSGTVTTGIVSALDRPVTTQGSGRTQAAEPIVTNALQTSAAINPGNSGGALVDAAGQLVGINSSIASLPSPGQSQAGSIGIGFAIPSAKVRVIVDQLISTGTAQHAFLGVGLSDGQAEVDGAVLSGAQVQQVEPSSPAEAAGLQVGDLIVAIDDEAVPSTTALVGQVRERGSGAQAVIDYVRDGRREQATATLAVRPDAG